MILITSTHLPSSRSYLREFFFFSSHHQQALGLPPLPPSSLPWHIETQRNAGYTRTQAAVARVSLTLCCRLIGSCPHVRRNDAKLTSPQQRVTVSFEHEKEEKEEEEEEEEAPLEK